MLYDCIADYKICPTKIVVFGLVRPVIGYSPCNMRKILSRGLEHYGNTKDQYGNIYELFADYDPCLATTKAIAIIIEEAQQ